MDFIILLALAGGLFAILTFIHFAVDWIFQTHAEAMAKHNNAKIRARHCAIYTLGFVPLLSLFMWLGALTLLQFVACVLILFISHFIEDTYLPVYLWAKYIRRPSEMTMPRKIPITTTTNCEVSYKILPPDPKIGFLEFVATPLGKILMIAIDQIIHLAFLFPIVWMVLRNFWK